METRHLRLFLASPGDVSRERDVVDEVATDLNDAQHADWTRFGRIHVDVLRWERFFRPVANRPQAAIFDQVGHFDLFMALLWSRCGTSTGHDDAGSEIAASGTLEEVAFALAGVKAARLRGDQLLIYRCTRNPSLPTPGHTLQFLKVQQFFAELESKAAIASYASEEEFRSMTRRHLVQAVSKLLSAPQEERVNVAPCTVWMTHESPVVAPRGGWPRPAYQQAMHDRLEVSEIDGVPGRLCVLFGPSGSGKSTIASLYFQTFPASKRWWLACKSTLEPFVQKLALEDADLVVLDGFEDRRFCWEIADLVPATCRLVVTCVSEELARRVLAHFPTADPTAMVSVHAIEGAVWSSALSQAIGDGPFPLIFDPVRGRFQGSVAALRLLLCALEKEVDRKTALITIRTTLEETAELAGSEIGPRGAPRIHRYEPVPHIARLWWKNNAEAGDLLWLLATVPLLGMSATTLAELLDRQLDDVEASLRGLEANSFIYPLHLGLEKLWIAYDFYRDAFEAIELFDGEVRRLNSIKDEYIKRCESLLRPGLMEKLDSAFVRASRAFGRINVGLVAQDLSSCLEIVKELRESRQDSLREGVHWLAIAQAISKRARACNQVIPIAQSITYLKEHPDLGHLAWQFKDVDDFWAAAVAVFAATKHWHRLANREPHAMALREFLQRLLASDHWRRTNGTHAFSDMLPAVVLGSLGVLGYAEWAKEELSSSAFKSRFPTTVFANLVPIVQALDRRDFDETQVLVDKCWASARNSMVKRFVADYALSMSRKINLVNACSDRSFDKTFGWDPRTTVAQLAFSASAMDFAEDQMRAGSGKYKGELVRAELFGSYDWFARQ